MPLPKTYLPRQNSRVQVIIIKAHKDGSGKYLAESLSSSACNSCRACQGITSGGAATAPHRMTVIAPKDLLLEVGMCVEVAARPGLGALSAFLLFGLPLLGFFAGMAIMGNLVPVLGYRSSEEWVFFGGMLGLAFGTAVSWAGSRLLGEERFLLNVERTISHPT